ncbi:DUF4351 domain-containing protein [Oscillatoriales cyanobacterium LEGE 11467]|uniref:DUF4351 domain-containing protein n=1 Tax=Zarconia navalis LEGE 11467 TaxID=1828826 RepID=A0A928Z7T2_9CYAN|nr:DUF4351 domain-containing protein [Zarconia navalis]MBE9041752.1 DUF4351 domain-containing protein [Zarconia navalis LEGE 11467]
MNQRQERAIERGRLFNELLSTFFWDFIALFLPHLAGEVDRESIAFVEPEVSSRDIVSDREETDFIARVQFRDRPTCFLIRTEHRASDRTGLARRMFHDVVELDRQYAIPIYPIVVFLDQSDRTSETNGYRVTFPDRQVLEFSFVSICLPRLNWQEFRDRHNPVAAALMAKMQMTLEERPRVKAECLRMLTSLDLNLDRAHLISGLIDTYLPLNVIEEQVFESEIDRMQLTAQEGIMEIVTSWMEKGIEQGIAQGISQGIEQGIEQGIGLGIVVTVLRQLKHRFGPLSPNLEKQVRDLSLEQLEVLSEALLDFESHADLEKWLFQAGFRQGLEQLLIGQIKHRFGDLESPIDELIQQLPIDQLEQLGKAMFEFKNSENLMDWLTDDRKRDNSL